MRVCIFVCACGCAPACMAPNDFEVFHQIFTKLTMNDF